ncbi:SGNH/GDSL hydrolase family protein [Bacillus sp. EB01]|uniref:SGNH/GDSL hydrolase family protein n=1 Tax=Bacillus sp. EB01 TaxID=1347086 RepID=UPI0006949661|nr:SGNH/GDSL hydrolase family protein [Bacillus sp. EB01]
MKVFLSIVLATACAAVLILGNVHWKENVIKNGDSSVVAKETETKSPSSNDSEDAKVEKASPDQALLTLAKNWPAKSLSGFQQALSENRPFKVVIVGSNAIGDETIGWGSLVKQGMTEAYGEGVIEVEITKYSSTTMDYVRGNLQDQLSGQNPDLVIFEPFLLSDNGYVRIEDTLVNVTSIIEDVQADNPQAEFILQPPNPIFKPKMYKTQVAELEKYATENGIVYFDHWESWPDPTSEEIHDYVDQTTKQPNEAGHKLWSNYILNYLIAK